MVSFNLTTLQLANNRIYHTIIRMPSLDRIIIEWVEDPDSESRVNLAVSRLCALRDKGAKIAIDDAGAGHDLMYRAAHIDPDWIKLDGELFQMGFAHDIGAKIIAEWVENDNQLHYAQQIGCGYAQGFGMLTI